MTAGKPTRNPNVQPAMSDVEYVGASASAPKTANVTVNSTTPQGPCSRSHGAISGPAATAASDPLTGSAIANTATGPERPRLLPQRGRGSSAGVVIVSGADIAGHLTSPHVFAQRPAPAGPFDSRFR